MMHELSLRQINDALPDEMQVEAAEGTWRSRLRLRRACSINSGGLSATKDLVFVTDWQGS